MVTSQLLKCFEVQWEIGLGIRSKDVGICFEKRLLSLQCKGHTSINKEEKQVCLAWLRFARSLACQMGLDAASMKSVALTSGVQHRTISIEGLLLLYCNIFR